MPKLYNDAVHGHIYLPDYLFKWIDKKEFQRLRRIKQLGCVEWVYEGATHTRFGHSIGVAYLANKMMKTINMDTEDVIEDITVAGLLHDIGHGPFSHLYEDVIHSKGLKYCHEQMSCDIIDYMYNKYKDLNEKYTNKRIEFIKSIIRGKIPDSYPADKLYHFEIVSNPFTSIDVDKFDYFQRDAKYANVQMTYNPSRFFNSFSIVNGHITYPIKEFYNIYELYHTRYILFKTVYYHKTSTSIEVMITDIFKKLNIPTNIEEFIKMTDDVIWSKKSDVLSRLENRDLYKVVWEGVFTNPENYKDITKSNLISFDSSLSNNVEVVVKQLNMTKNDNPMKYIYFSKNNEICKADINQTTLIPSHFEENIVRIVAKSSFEHVKKSVNKFIKDKNINENLFQYK